MSLVNMFTVLVEKLDFYFGLHQNWFKTVVLKKLNMTKNKNCQTLSEII